MKMMDARQTMEIEDLIIRNKIDKVIHENNQLVLSLRQNGIKIRELTISDTISG